MTGHSSRALCLIAVLAMILTAGAAAAVDDEGKFASKGIGTYDCQHFLQVQLANGEGYLRLKEWLNGYLTAVNRYEEGTFDIAPWQSMDVMMAIMRDSCEKNPRALVATVVQAMVAAFRETRLASHSSMISMNVGDSNIRVYVEVMRRAQERLTELGLYSGAADGVFGEETQEALAMFQMGEGLGATGLPDPLTIWHLLEP